MNRVLTIMTALIVAVQGCLASSDSTKYTNDTVKFEVKQIIAPTSMIAAGALFVGIKPLVQARKWVNKEVGVHKTKADEYIQYLPAAAYLGLEYTGLKCRRPIVDRLIVGVTSTIIMTAVTQGIKYTVNEQRPDSDKKNSFPSGHSATAFMGAELLRQEYGPWVGAAGYVVASGVGVMRILNGRHWLNDVVAGAGIGILSAKAGEWLLPFNRRWMGLDKHRKGTAAVVLPTYNAETNALGLTAAVIF